MITVNLRVAHLQHTCLVRREGIEPPSLLCKSRALPLDERRKIGIPLLFRAGAVYGKTHRQGLPRACTLEFNQAAYFLCAWGASLAID